MYMQEENYAKLATNKNVWSQVLTVGTLIRGIIESVLIVKYAKKYGCNPDTDEWGRKIQYYDWGRTRPNVYRCDRVSFSIF